MAAISFLNCPLDFDYNWCFLLTYWKMKHKLQHLIFRSKMGHYRMFSKFDYDALFTSWVLEWYVFKHNCVTKGVFSDYNG